MDWGILKNDYIAKPSRYSLGRYHKRDDYCCIIRQKGKYGLGSKWEAIADTMNSILQRLSCRGTGGWDTYRKWCRTCLTFIHLLNKRLRTLLGPKWRAWAECRYEGQLSNRKQSWEIHIETNGRGPKTPGKTCPNVKQICAYLCLKQAYRMYHSNVVPRVKGK